MKLYRVMCQAEFDDLTRFGEFRDRNGSMTHKWFAERLEHAVVWGKQFEAWDNIPHDRYIMIDVPDELADAFDPISRRMDGVGPARCARVS